MIRDPTQVLLLNLVRRFKIVIAQTGRLHRTLHGRILKFKILRKAGEL